MTPVPKRTGRNGQIMFSLDLIVSSHAHLSRGTHAGEMAGIPGDRWSPVRESTDKIDRKSLYTVVKY